MGELICGKRARSRVVHQGHFGVIVVKYLFLIISTKENKN